jgi:cysteinyl-tRNA synthetase
MYLWNTLSRKKELFQAQEDGKVRIYTCGPTVYNYAHIGNLRTYVFEDLLRRSLTFLGWKVEQVMNITDIDDKTIKGAIREGVTLTEYTKKYTDAFFEDLRDLNIQEVEHYPKATDYIEAMIALIQNLIDKKLAYKSGDGSIYFSIKTFPSYGKLSHLKLSELRCNASKRVDNDEYDKENVGDFVLWKAYDTERDETIFWESPFGPGRPGWHIECSTMAMSILGETLDIHVGGVDNIFPHHENEIAQSEGCTGSMFARYWLHSEHLIVDGKKMAKSSNNFYTLRDLINKGVAAEEVRYLLLQTHYRTQLNFTFDGLEGAKASLQRIEDFLYRLRSYREDNKENTELDLILNNALEQFTYALEDDLNISVALSVLFDLIRDVNVKIDEKELSIKQTDQVIDWLKKINTVLGVINFKEKETEIPQRFQDLLEKRSEARINKEWALADKIRDQIISGGFTIEDTPHGQRLKKRKLK